MANDGPLHTLNLYLQAVLILGSTDFLGNPIGFINDISEGVSGLVSDGNVGGLFKNVAHGAANSAAKGCHGFISDNSGIYLWMN